LVEDLRHVVRVDVAALKSSRVAKRLAQNLGGGPIDHEDAVLGPTFRAVINGFRVLGYSTQRIIIGGVLKTRRA
jgi:hypothetical protein